MKQIRRARTLYPCEADNPSELSFEANVIITNGLYKIIISKTRN